MTPLDLTGLWQVRAGFGVLIGAVFGSFAATAALRASHHKPAIFGCSACDGCARSLKFAETVPFVGYALSGGQCRTCSAPIDRFHLVGEALGAGLLSLVWLLEPTLSGFLTGGICLLLLISSLIDLKTLRLPDSLTLAIALCGLTLSVIANRWIPGLIAGSLSAVALYGLKRFLDHRHNKSMLGLGDVKLVGALGLWLGVKTPDMLALAAILGLGFILVTRRKLPLPFGPMLGLSSFLIGVCIPEGWLI